MLPCELSPKSTLRGGWEVVFQRIYREALKYLWSQCPLCCDLPSSPTLVGTAGFHGQKDQVWTPDASRTNQILPSGDLDLRGSGSPR